MVMLIIVVLFNVPIMADVETGYGNALNVCRTVWEFENVLDEFNPKVLIIVEKPEENIKRGLTSNIRCRYKIFTWKVRLFLIRKAKSRNILPVRVGNGRN